MKVPVAVHVDPETLAKLDALAARLKVSRAQVMRWAIDAYLSQEVDRAQA